MSRWFPEVDDSEGIKKALNAGFYGTLAFAAMNCLGLAFILFAGRLPGSGNQPSSPTGAVMGVVVELAIVLIAAWRFRIGNGLVWGSIALLMFAAEIVAKVVSGTTGFGWFFFYAAVGAGLVNGVRGAWAARTVSPEEEYREIFE